MPDDVLPSSFDDFMNPQTETTKEEETEKQTLEKRFEGERFQWGGKVKGMSSKIKSLQDLSDLQVEVYSERQRALEYYHYIISLLIKVNKVYNKQYSEKYKFYKYQSQERIPNENLIKIRINSELEDLKEKREILDNHAKFMDGTVKTIDNIIFGIKTRVEVEQIGRGR